jgi:hypothetical protein
LPYKLTCLGKNSSGRRTRHEKAARQLPFGNDGSLWASYETASFNPFDTVRDAMSFPEAGGGERDIGGLLEIVNHCAARGC